MTEIQLIAVLNKHISIDFNGHATQDVTINFLKEIHIMVTWDRKKVH